MARIQTPTLALLAAALLTATAAGSFSAQAQDVVETLGNMHKTAPVDWPVIPQTGPKADQIRQNLEKIKMPPGFHIALYAIVPDARHMAVGPQGVVTIVGTRKTKA